MVRLCTPKRSRITRTLQKRLGRRNPRCLAIGPNSGEVVKLGGGDDRVASGGAVARGRSEALAQRPTARLVRQPPPRQHPLKVGSREGQSDGENVNNEPKVVRPFPRLLIKSGIAAIPFAATGPGGASDGPDATGGFRDRELIVRGEVRCPCRGKSIECHPYHGLRCASPVATTRGPCRGQRRGNPRSRPAALGPGRGIGV